MGSEDGLRARRAKATTRAGWRADFIPTHGAMKLRDGGTCAFVPWLEKDNGKYGDSGFARMTTEKQRQ
jgi:hypothetical protein